MHSGRSQDQRSESIKGFRTDVFNILIATDVAGRGIDVPDVALVINYDMANTCEAYTHRIGRTGRAGKKGIAATFLTMGDTEVRQGWDHILVCVCMCLRVVVSMFVYLCHCHAAGGYNAKAQ